MFLSKIKKPFSFIIFGASGDLAKLKLFPGLYELALQRRFPEQYVILGYGRTAMSDEDFRKEVAESVRTKFGKSTDAKTLKSLQEHCFFFHGQYDQPSDFQRMARKLLELQQGKKVDTAAYFAVPPQVFKPIIEQLAGVRMTLGVKPIIILEKPFGDSEASATDLYHFASRFFEPSEVFLLDHYLGKAAVQSILPLRYNNVILDTLLKGSKIANIQINALEEVGVDKRVSYFESVGIIKDMMQSHLMQILSLFTMSLPVNPDMDSIRREKVNLFSALRYGDTPCGIVLGQYKGYKQEKGVAKGSRTPTFAAARFFIDLLDWYQVPIYMRTGKKLGHKNTYVVVEFKKPSFQQNGKGIETNKLVIELFPEEKIQIRLVNEEGKMINKFREIISADSLACAGDDCLPEHGRLILDAFLDNRMHFLSFEEIIACWKFVDRLLVCAEKRAMPVHEYGDASDGPKEQHNLIRQDNFEWFDPSK
jgi:glucose-6-phosphate 1-dehydrogenase